MIIKYLLEIIMIEKLYVKFEEKKEEWNECEFCINYIQAILSSFSSIMQCIKPFLPFHILKQFEY